MAETLSCRYRHRNVAFRRSVVDIATCCSVNAVGILARGRIKMRPSLHPTVAEVFLSLSLIEAKSEGGMTIK